MKSILRLQKYGGSYRKKRKVEIFNEVQSQLQQTNTHESYRGIKMRNEHKCHKQSLMTLKKRFLGGNPVLNYVIFVFMHLNHLELAI